ncbi:GDSL esterase/lipase At1g28570-like [Aristolochia californica]|uniref:GDSL esterase/lipase At1g28570-like n=1 Tax=Aristolochia californica TaxID=171875 RepID=UPI0035DD6502
MASSKFAIVIIVFALAILRFPDSAASGASHFGGFDALYSFGDSMADTGNLISEGLGPIGAFDRFPYGETYFGRPTGRCSNGRLMIDFIAERFDLPFLNAYLDRNASFANGVNFAVAGATALDASYLESVGIVLPFTKSSLNVQLDWFETHLASLCSTHKECRAKLGTALFFLGEIGGNDYNYAIFKGKTISEATSLMPLIIKTIKDAAKKVIKHGARHLIVPGNFPTGCATCYLTAFRSTNSSDYDGRRCLKRYNEFAQLHNNQLQLMLQSLRERFPSVNIQYADYYNVSLQVSIMLRLWVST